MQLSRQIDMARDEVRTRLRHRVNQLRDRYDAKMQGKIKPNMIPEIEAAIVSDLCELQDEIDGAVREHITEIAHYLLAGIAAVMVPLMPWPTSCPPAERRRRSFSGSVGGRPRIRRPR
jgi:hypothetical protein